MPRKAYRWIAVYPLVLTAVLVVLAVIQSRLAPAPTANSDFSQPATAVYYWAQAPDVVGFNHGIAGFMILFFGLISYGIWLGAGREKSPAVQIGLVAGILYGVIHGISLTLQATTMVMASKGVQAYPDLASSFVALGYWAMKGGGLSDTLYSIAFLFQGIWLMAHGAALSGVGWRKMGSSGFVLGGLTVAISLVNGTFLMSSGVNELAHNFQQLLANGVVIWVDILAIHWIRQQSANNSSLPQSTAL